MSSVLMHFNAHFEVQKSEALEQKFAVEILFVTSSLPVGCESIAREGCSYTGNFRNFAILVFLLFIFADFYCNIKIKYLIMLIFLYIIPSI